MGSLTIDRVQKSFGQVEVLKDISIEADQGEFLVLVGPSGCGKSTLLAAIAGLQKTDGGAIRIDGRDVTGLAPKDRDIAMVFQTYALYPNLSVAENMAFPLEARGVTKAERREAVERVANLLHIDDLLDRRPRQLSGGQRQRVAMGRALVRDPEIFLFDEPLSNLDAKLRVVMRTEIKKLHQRLGVTMVYVTHDQIEAMTLATKIVVMQGGVIQQTGSPIEIYERPENMFVAGFMGSPAMNFAPCRLAIEAGANAIELTPPDGTAQRLQLPKAPMPDGLAGKPLVLGLRPEAISDKPFEAGVPSAQVDWPVDILEPTGADTMAILPLPGEGEMVAKLSARTQVAAGATATLHINLASLCLFDPATEATIWRAAD